MVQRIQNILKSHILHIQIFIIGIGVYEPYPVAVKQVSNCKFQICKTAVIFSESNVLPVQDFPVINHVIDGKRQFMQ